jgi:hypothetical protein
MEPAPVMASEAKPSSLSAIARLARVRFGGALDRFAEGNAKRFRGLAMTVVQLEPALL